MSFTIISVSNPVYSSADSKQITCDVVTQEHGEIQFTATSFDVMPYGVAFYNQLVAGNYGVIGAYVAPAPAPSSSPNP